MQGFESFWGAVILIIIGVGFATAVSGKNKTGQLINDSASAFTGSLRQMKN